MTRETREPLSDEVIEYQAQLAKGDALARQRRRERERQRSARRRRRVPDELR